MANLTRKKVKVRSKSGKVYQRSMLVRSAKPVNSRGKLHSLNPWEARHVDHVSTNSVLPADRARLYGSSGPGSDHSAFALATGHYKQQSRAHFERGHIPEFGTSGHGSIRRDAGSAAAAAALGQFYTAQFNTRPASVMLGRVFGTPHQPSSQRISEIAGAFGVPSSHVRRNYKGARFPSNW